MVRKGNDLMQLFGGNGKNGKHSASGRNSSERKNNDEYIGSGYSDNEYHHDDDYDYERRYSERMKRTERNEQYAHRDAENASGNMRFASDDIVSREERQRGKPRWPKRLAATVLVLAVVVIGVYAGYRAWAKAPTQQQSGLNDYTTPAPQESEGVSAVEPENVANHRDGVYTFFIAGIDVVGYHNDTNMVGMFDTVNGKLNIVNLPRDMLVNVNLNIKKINQPYAAAINNGTDGVEALLDCIADIVGYQVDMYALIDINAAAEIVDAIGGVYFDIPFDMDWDAPDQDLYIHIKAGPQTLSGDDFVKAMRFRMSNDGSHSYAGGDIQRIEFQQELLMALASQTLQLGNIGKVGEIYNAVMDNMTTNVSLGNVMYLLEQFMKLDTEDITFQTIPNRMDGMIYGLNYVMPKIDEWVVMINEYLNPFDVEITENNLDMISYIDGVWTMTQGYIAGGDESFHRFG